MVMLCHAPSRKSPEAVRAPGKYYGHLAREGSIVLAGGPSAPLAPGPNAHRPGTGAMRLFICPLLQTTVCNQMFAPRHEGNTCARPRRTYCMGPVRSDERETDARAPPAMRGARAEKPNMRRNDGEETEDEEGQAAEEDGEGRRA